MNDINKNIGANNDDMALEVKKAFIGQFAENQNHHQSLFIQFLSVVIIALIAYVYVYINTSSYVPDKLSVTTTISPQPISDTSGLLTRVEAKTFEAIKDTEGRILSYGKVHLAGTYFFAQLVLVVLALTLLHLGYSYRRDQQVVHAIRMDSLGVSNFRKFFPSGYTGLGKRFTNYLPNFYAILFMAIFVIQLIIYWSIFLYFNRFPETFIDNNQEKLLIFLKDIGFGYNLSYRTLKLILAIPFGITFCFYFLYFGKYNTRVNNIRLTTQLTITESANKKNIFATAFICLGFTAIKILAMMYWDEFSMALLSSAIISFTTFLTHIWTNFLRLTTRGKNISNGIFYFVSAIAIFLCTIIGVINHIFQTSQKPVDLFWVCLVTVVLFYISSQLLHKRFIRIGSNKAFITHQLKQEAYFFIILSVVFLLILFSKIIFLDYILSGLFGLLSFAWSVRSITYLIDAEFGRNKELKETVFPAPGFTHAEKSSE